MKKMLQNSIIVLSLFCITFFKKCGQENQTKQQVVKNERITVKRLSCEELRKKNNVTKKLNEIVLTLATDPYNTKNHLRINREEAVCITEKGITSYTFPVTRQYPVNKIENLVLHYTKDGSCNVFFTTYALTRKQVLELHRIGSLENKMTVAIQKEGNCDSGEKNQFYKYNALIKVPITWTNKGEAVTVLEWLQKQECDEQDLNGKSAPVLQIMTTPVVGMAFTSFLEKFKQEITVVAPNSLWWKTTSSDAVVLYLKEYFDPKTGLGNTEINEFATWAVGYLCKHPEVSWEHLVNWFLTPVEMDDGYCDSWFWGNIEQKYPLKKLPPYVDFSNAFPKMEEDGIIYHMPSDTVYKRVGGAILAKHQEENSKCRNACAVRASLAFNYSGIPIDVGLNGSEKVDQGADGNYYIVSAKAFNIWMKKTFGRPTFRLTGTKANCRETIAAFLKDKTGVYTVVNKNSRRAGFSGHVDLISNGECLSGASLYPKGGIKYIEIWQLK
ncbi:T6SS effector amidase Tae4 family protein [Flavobacterium sp.]|uniref:T6SS effector amidase Tae4 family protein n=1 Tax=Flavobacterium sp. TaxID=239 RepID=UPI00263294FB|nr:T6SS effector amidase Tae4 family protein [Flavobacterium sp.]